jgi:hypothetical protein
MPALLPYHLSKIIFIRNPNPDKPEKKKIFYHENTKVQKNEKDHENFCAHAAQAPALRVPNLSFTDTSYAFSGLILFFAIKNTKITRS